METSSLEARTVNWHVCLGLNLTCSKDHDSQPTPFASRNRSAGVGSGLGSYERSFLLLHVFLTWKFSRRKLVKQVSVERRQAQHKALTVNLDAHVLFSSNSECIAPGKCLETGRLAW